MLSNLREAVTAQLLRVEVMTSPPAEPEPPMSAHHIDADTGEDEFALADDSFARQATLAPSADAGTLPRRDPNDPSSWGRVGRNEPCPCGSGLKYKHCHGKFI